jgi:hypothetical protein
MAFYGWPSAIAGQVLDLLAGDPNVGKAPIVHCSQFGDAIAGGEPANQLLD